MTLNKRKFYLNKPLALKHSGKLNLEVGAAHIRGAKAAPKNRHMAAGYNKQGYLQR